MVRVFLETASCGNQGDQEVQCYTGNVKPLVNRKNNGMVGARRAFASKVRAAMIDGLGMRAADDDRGQSWAS